MKMLTEDDPFAFEGLRRVVSSQHNVDACAMENQIRKAFATAKKSILHQKDSHTQVRLLLVDRDLTSKQDN